MSSKIVPKFNFQLNDPFDREAEIKLVVPQLHESKKFMGMIRDFPVASDSLAIWFLGQNCFILKTGTGKLLITDPYLSDYCGKKYQDFKFRLNRQLPVFIEPEDVDVDLLLCTHSHDDHADPETLGRLSRSRETSYLGPWQAVERFREHGLAESQIRLMHPLQTMEIEGIKITGVFAMPTDDSDLNHMGFLLEFENGIRFYNSGDTAYSDLLGHVAGYQPDICTICINGGFLNLSHFDAARIVNKIQPRVVIPCHYDMMVNNVQDPDMFRASLEIVGSQAEYHQMGYYEPFVYKKGD